MLALDEVDDVAEVEIRCECRQVSPRKLRRRRLCSCEGVRVGVDPELTRRTPIVWSSERVAVSWGLTRTLTGLGATALMTALMEARSGRFGA